MQCNVNLDAICELERLHLNLSHLYILDCIIKNNEEVYGHAPMALFQTLQRKGYLTPESHITDQGKKLHELLTDPVFCKDTTNLSKEVKKAKKDRNAQYSEWMKHYPATATWEDEETHKVWEDSRSLRKHTADTERMYVEIIEAGEFTHEEMCMALDFQVEIFHRDSRRERQNKMHYFQATPAYLNQETYRKWIETMKLTKWKPKTELSKTIGVSNSDSLQL